MSHHVEVPPSVAALLEAEGRHLAPGVLGQLIPDHTLMPAGARIRGPPGACGRARPLPHRPPPSASTRRMACILQAHIHTRARPSRPPAPRLPPGTRPPRPRGVRRGEAKGRLHAGRPPRAAGQRRQAARAAVRAAPAAQAPQGGRAPAPRRAAPALHHAAPRRAAPSPGLRAPGAPPRVCVWTSPANQTLLHDITLPYTSRKDPLTQQAFPRAPAQGKAPAISRYSPFAPPAQGPHLACNPEPLTQQTPSPPHRARRPPSADTAPSTFSAATWRCRRPRLRR